MISRRGLLQSIGIAPAVAVGLTERTPAESLHAWTGVGWHGDYRIAEDLDARLEKLLLALTDEVGTYIRAFDPKTATPEEMQGFLDVAESTMRFWKTLESLP